MVKPIKYIPKIQDKVQNIFKDLMGRKVEKFDSLLKIFNEVGVDKEFLLTLQSEYKTHLGHLAAIFNRADILELLPEELLSKPNADGLSPIHRAASALAEEALDYLITKKVDLNVAMPVKSNNPGLTAVHLAVHARPSDYGTITEVIKKLKKAGANLDAQTTPLAVRDPTNNTAIITGKFTPLHLAVKADSQEALEALLAAGADPNKVDAMGATPLIQLTQLNPNLPAEELRITKDIYLERAKILLSDPRTNPDIVLNEIVYATSFDSAMHIAVLHLFPEMLELLASHHANPSLKNGRRATPLDIVEGKRRQVDEKDEALGDDEGAVPDIFVANREMQATMRAHLELALENRHAKVEMPEWPFAETEATADLTEELKNYLSTDWFKLDQVDKVGEAALQGANLYVRGKGTENGKEIAREDNIAHVLAYFGRVDYLVYDEIKKLFAVPNIHEQLPLHMTAIVPNLNTAKTIKLLCEALPVSVHHRDINGETALLAASGMGNLEAVKALHAAGSDVNTVNLYNPSAGRFQNTPLQIAAQHGNLDVADYLVEHADLYREDVHGNHVIHHFMRGIGRATIELLEKGGVKLFIEPWLNIIEKIIKKAEKLFFQNNYQSESPIEVAIKESHDVRVVEYMWNKTPTHEVKKCKAAAKSLQNHLAEWSNKTTERVDQDIVNWVIDHANTEKQMNFLGNLNLVVEEGSQ